MITGCFHLFTTQARANPLALKVCLHYDALTFNTAGMIPNPSQVSLMNSFNEKGKMVCRLWVDLGLDQFLNRGVEAENETPGCMQTVVLEALSQSHHKHLRVQGWTAVVPP